MKKEKTTNNQKKSTQGWQCPVCGCVWSWFQKGCDYCNSVAAIRSPQTKDASSTIDYLKEG